MKKPIVYVFACVLAVSTLYAQTIPQGMRYQAVARDLSGQIIANQAIDLRIQLQHDASSYQLYYSEVHRVVTNQFGLFSLVIGEGTVEQGSFKDIPWETDNIWMDIAIKTDKDTQFTSISNSKLLAVPYAYHAGTAGKLSGRDSNNDNAKEGVPSQNWSLFGNARTNPDKDRLGTSDSTDFVLMTNNKERLRITSKGQLITADGVGLNLGGNLKVRGDSVNIDKDLFVGRNVYLNTSDEFSPRGQTINYGNFTSRGQVTIQTTLAGADNLYDSYPLRVEGAQQGIAVKVNAYRGNANNFVTFWDAEGIQGRIEGQSSDELHNSFRFIWDNVMAGLDEAFVVAEGIACGTQLDLAEVGVMVAEGASMYAKWLELAISAENNVGVAFESGSGDYAEWLEKASPAETFSFGDIVGVSGGKISKSMSNASHYLVVSKSPIVLGNMPPAGRQNDYEKIAFIGQVPVKVRGRVNIGDYIIASDLNDGFGIAVSSKEIQLNQFERIVGVAWSEAKSESGFSMVNTAVGINTNDVVLKLKQQEEEITSVKYQMNKIIAYLQSKDPSFDIDLLAVPAEKAATQKQEPAAKVATQLSDYTVARNAFYQKLKENPELLNQILANTRKSLDENGIDYNRFEQTRRMLTDGNYLLTILQNRK
jgi:hypothetical protein